jgi:hypothetical protein
MIQALPTHNTAYVPASRGKSNSLAATGEDTSGHPVADTMEFSSSERIAKLQDEASQLHRFSHRLSSLSLASTAGLFAMSLLGGPALILPALGLVTLSALSCIVSESSRNEAIDYEDMAEKLKSQVGATASPTAPVAIAVLTT